MALKLTQIFKGVPANYWKILSISEDLFSNKTTVRLGLYVNDKTRKSNVKNVIDYKIINISGVDLTRPQLYAAIKALPLFKDAVNC